MSSRIEDPRRPSETARALLLTTAALAASLLIAGVLAVSVHALHGALDDAVASQD